MLFLVGFSGFMSAVAMDDNSSQEQLAIDLKNEFVKQSTHRVSQSVVDANTVTNGILTVYVFPSTGQFSVKTGMLHPVPDTNILYPADTSYTTIKSVTSNTLYTTGGRFGGVPIGATGLGIPTIVQSDTGFTMTYVVTSPDHLTVEQTVNIIGTTLSDSYVKVDTKITNNDTVTTTTSVRHLWDYELGSDDGPTFRARNQDDSTLFLSKDFVSPDFEFYDIQSNSYSNDLIVSGTSSGPSTYSPTTPARLSYVSWALSVGSPYDYTVPIDASVNSDSAVLYYFGSNTPLTINSGASSTVSASIFGPAAIVAAELHGTKWSDVNANGLLDNGEVGVQGVQICLDRVTAELQVVESITCTTTLSDGTYSFTNMLSGFYKVSETLPVGSIQTFPPNGQPHYISVSSAQVVTNVNFGNVVGTPVVINGEVWGDTDQDGTIDAGESGLLGVSVCVQQTVTCTTTASDGTFTFTGLSPGSFDVYVIPGTRVATTPTVVSFTSTGGTQNNVNFGLNTPLPPPTEVILGGMTAYTHNGLPNNYYGDPVTITKNVGPDGSNHCGSDKPTQIKVEASFTNGHTRSKFMTQSTDDPNTVTDESEKWSATFLPFKNAGDGSPGTDTGTATIKFKVDCPATTVGFPDVMGSEDEIQAGGNIYVDPEGTIIDACTSTAISGATATLLIESPPGTGNYITPDTSDHIPVTNPQTTGTDGAYGWVVVPGTWKVEASATGYTTTQSAAFDIPPAVTDLVIELTPTAGCPVSVPDMPTSLTATALSSSQIDLSWTAPADDGGSAITGYMIHRDGVMIVSDTASTGTTYSDTGLEPNTEYTYVVMAINSAGTSAESNESTATTDAETNSFTLSSSGTAKLKKAVTGTHTFGKGTYDITVQITADIDSVNAKGIPKLSHIAGTFAIDGSDSYDAEFTNLKLTVDKKLKMIKWSAKEGSGQFKFLDALDFTEKTDQEGTKSTIKIKVGKASFAPKVSASSIAFE